MRGFASRGCWEACLLARRVLALVLVLVLSVRCATTGSGSLGIAEGPLPPDMEPEVLEAGGVAEATLALAQVWSVASGVREVGSRLAFTFWSERGALTLTGYSAAGRDGPVALPVDDEAFQEELAKVLTRFAQRRTGLVTLTLERQHARWTVAYSTAAQLRPLEAKTLPVRRAGYSSETVEAVTQGLGRLLRVVEVPTGGEAQVELECALEDGRSEEWRLRLFEVMHDGAGGPARPLSPAVRSEAVAVLLSFTQGLGERTVHLRLRLSVPPGARQARGSVEEASVERPASPPAANAEFVAEYRAMHEDILRRWREETKDGAWWVATRGAEELALWYAGGIALRGLGWLGGRVAPTVLRALQRSGSATGWLRTTLMRLSTEERLVFERLWSKVQLEGKGALSSAERAELRELMVSIERLIHEPLDDRAKRLLRDRARAAYKSFRPELERVMAEQGSELPVHHRHSLEYAHLFPEEDVNSVDNLILMTRSVHERLNAIWIKFRRARPEATAEEVEAVARVIDKQFKPWYHQASPPSQVPYSLKEAEGTVLKRLQEMFPGLS